MRLAMLAAPHIDHATLPYLRAFNACLSHRPTEVQIDLLRQATTQIVETLEQSLVE
jgi:hypothetical protein